MTNPKEKAVQMIKQQSTKAMIDQFVLTGLMDDPCIPIVRGWIMDELEERDVKAFAAWIDSDAGDESLYEFFRV